MSVKIDVIKTKDLFYEKIKNNEAFFFQAKVKKSKNKIHFIFEDKQWELCKPRNLNKFYKYNVINTGRSYVFYYDRKLKKLNNTVCFLLIYNVDLKFFYYNNTLKKKIQKININLEI